MDSILALTGSDYKSTKKKNNGSRSEDESIPAVDLARSGQLGGRRLRSAGLRLQLLLLRHQIDGRNHLATTIALAVVVGRIQVRGSFRKLWLRLGTIGQAVLEAQGQVVLTL